MSGTWRLAAIEQETDQCTILDIETKNNCDLAASRSLISTRPAAPKLRQSKALGNKPNDLELVTNSFWPENSVLNRSGSFASFRESSFLVLSCYRYLFNSRFPPKWKGLAVCPDPSRSSAGERQSCSVAERRGGSSE